MNEQPFKFLSDAEYEALTTAQKLEYLSGAVAHRDRVSDDTAARIAELGDEFAKRRFDKLTKE
jgi:hypothetical protein